MPQRILIWGGAPLREERRKKNGVRSPCSSDQQTEIKKGCDAPSTSTFHHPTTTTQDQLFPFLFLQEVSHFSGIVFFENKGKKEERKRGRKKRKLEG